MKIGDRVKDKVTGFTGIATARCAYFNGCIQFEVTAQKLVAGKMLPSAWMDEQRLSVVKKAKAAPKEKAVRRGGLQNEPLRTPPPSSHEEEA